MDVVKIFTPPKPLETAVLFLIFRRPDITKQVFEQIRKAKPPRLYIAADGPRENVPGEAELVRQTREYVLNNIDWDCEVKTLFRDKNLGCGKAVSEAITWFFEHEEMGIILEDDTVPSLSFFWFCEELLERYKDDERVGMISGNNFFYQIGGEKESFHFSVHGGIWGWASWRRVWEKYDVNMSKWSEIDKENFLSNYFFNKKLKSIWKNRFEKVYKGEIDTWDFQWAFARYLNRYLTIRPNLNLVANIGFDKNATHTKGNPNRVFLKKYEIHFPLKTPIGFIVNKEADEVFFYNVIKPFWKKAIDKLFYLR